MEKMTRNHAIAVVGVWLGFALVVRAVPTETVVLFVAVIAFLSTAALVRGE